MVHSVQASFHGEGYGDDWDSYPLTPQRSNSSSNYKPAAQPAGLNGSAFNRNDYDSPPEDRASFTMALNTKVRNQNQDVVGRHLLYETAMLDSNAFEILTIEEVEELKKELTRLHSRIDSAQRRLALESKVKDAATNLQRLYSNDSSRADSPQHPESPKRARRSLLSGKQRSGSNASNDGKTLSQTESELATSTRKVDELNETIKSLLDRRQTVERKLLRHTAAVLSEQQSKQGEETAQTPRELDDDDASVYSPDEFDGIRDILLCKPAHNKLHKRGPQKLQEEHEQQLHSMQTRLEHLNDQLRNVISEASKTRGVSLGPEQIYNPVDGDDTAARLNADFDRFENNLRTLQQEHEDTQKHYAHIQESSYQTRNAVEEQLEGLNTQLYNTLMLSPAAQSISDLEEPPKATGHGYQPQLAYLEESFLNIEQLLRRHTDDLQTAREGGMSEEKTTAQTNKLNEYEATIGGLWEIMQTESSLRTPPIDEGRFSGTEAPRSPLTDSFSLPAFSSRVQHLFNRASSANEQQDILRRQIQQQRDLNGKSDAEKDRQLEELTTKQQQLVASGEQMQEELAKTMAQHQQAETDVNQLKVELLNVENEFAELRRTAELKHQEREEMARQLQAQQENTGHLQQEIQELEAQVANMESGSAKHADLAADLTAANAAREEAERKHAAATKEMEQIESEVVRLSTELTMAKAELDGAYGSRAERAKEAQGSEIQVLSQRNAEITSELAALRAERGDNSRVNALEQELQAMTNDFQELTREALQMEHERGQLDSLIDGLRDRCDALEGQLSDERVRWIGVKSPGGPTATAGDRGSALPARETTSVTVMRQEFKKMMRETRAEGVRLLRTEQEERRKLEAEIRRLKNAAGGATTPGSMSLSPRLSNGHHHGQGHGRAVSYSTRDSSTRG